MAAEAAMESMWQAPRHASHALARCAALLAVLYWLVAPLQLRAAAATIESLAGDYRYCTLCHGATGNGNVAIQAPALAGIEEWYLRGRLQAYRTQQLGHDFAKDPAGTEMRTVAREVGEERFADIGRYIAAMRNDAPTATVTGDAAAGRRLYAAQCVVCHGARGEGNAQLHAPGLARLNDWYLVSSFGKYRTGLRGAEGSDPYAQQMRALGEAMGPAFAINDVAAFLRTLHPARSGTKADRR